jgi:6-phosphogluconolactonase (cycloisomerase 2 family)
MMNLLRNAVRVQAIGIMALSIVIGSAFVGDRGLAQSGGASEAAGRSFVYTITNPNGPNAIAAYEAHPETGELIFLGTYPTGGRGTGKLIDSQSPLVANAAGTLLFAVNPGSNDISVMAINDDGSLALLDGPVPSRGVEPASLALKNDLLYVANKGDAVDPPNYSGFQVDSDGTLTRIKRRIGLAFGDNPTQVLFTSDGGTLLGIRFGSGGLDSYAVKPNGRLRLRSQLNDQRGPFAAVVNPVAGDQLIVADARLPGASTYVMSEDRALTPITSVSNRPERAACWIVAHSNGSRVWVSNTGTNSLSLYTIGSDGSLSLQSTHGTAAYGRTPFEIALDPGNRFLYQLNVGAGNQSIHALRVTDSFQDAGLTDIGAIGLPAGSSPIGLVVASRLR